MTLWWQALVPIFCIFLSCVEICCASPPVLQRYNNSFRLTKLTRTRVQQLLTRYKDQELGFKHFEDRSRQLTGLPSPSTDFYCWLKLKDWERLHAAFRDLHTYWDMLEQKKQQLWREQKEQRGSRKARRRTRPTITLPESIEHIQLDLRDLMRQVNSQMRHINSSRMSPISPTVSMNAPSNAQLSSQTPWDSWMEGYIILRDLDLYLIKLARDFLLLASSRSSTHDSQLKEH